MKLIDRYILRNHIAPFIFGTVVVLFLFLMQFLISSLEKLVGKGLSEWLIIKLIVYNMAWMVILSVPMGVLFSTLMAFGSMSMSHEVTIIKASGGSLIRMMMPVIIASILLYYGLFWFNDNVLPESNHQVKIMMNDITRKKPTFSLESGLFSTQLEGYTILARNVDSISGALSGVTIYDMTNFHNRNIISSDSGWINFTPDYKKLVLDLKDGEVHQLITNFVGNYKVINFSKYRIALNAYGFAFEQSSSDMVSKGDREMNVSDMSEIVSTALSNRKNHLNRVDSMLNENLAEIVSGINYNNANLIKENKDSANIHNIITQEKKVKVKEIEKEQLGQRRKRDTSSGMKYIEEINKKYQKTLETGNTDLNKDSIYSDETKERLSKAIHTAKVEYDKEKAQKEIIDRIQNDSITKINLENKKNENIAKIEYDEKKAQKEIIDRIKSDSIARINLENKKNENIEKIAEKNLATYKEINKSNYDTSYVEVLNRVIQQANLLKSLIQPDINNSFYFNTRAEQYKVEIYKKYALPFACIVFVFVGCPLGIKTRGGNFGISAGISLAFYIFYWACLIGGEKLADRGIVAPWLAMWLANIVVGIIGIVLTITVNNETFSFKTFFHINKLTNIINLKK